MGKVISINRDNVMQDCFGQIPDATEAACQDCVSGCLAKGGFENSPCVQLKKKLDAIDNDSEGRKLSRKKKAYEQAMG
jgi:hypothetical protein